MASINVAAPASTFALTVVPKSVRSPVLGLPQLRTNKATTLTCSASKSPAGAAATLLAGAATSAGPALALVDERMSTEGTGLSLGISDNLLGWILLGVFGLIWSLYTVYTSTLDEDEESGGLSL